MSRFAALLPFLFVPVLVGGLLVGYLLEERHRKRLLAFALRRGWRYAGDDPSLVHRWPGEPFGVGDKRRASNVLIGQEAGRAFVAFDYTYVTHRRTKKGRRSTTHRYGVCVVPMRGFLPTVQVEPENAFHKVAGAVGLLTDIDLESEVFNRMFRVSATSAKLASDILTPRTMEYLIAAEPEAWRTCGTDLVSWAEGRLDPVEVVRTCGVLDRVEQSIPAFVWADHGVR